MQWTNTRTMMIGLLSLLLVTPSFAQRGAENAAVFRASKVIGANVDNRQGEDLGNIEDVIIDSQTGHVAYAVLASGGFLGLGEKHFVIPWSALTPQAGTLTAREQFILHIDKERLANAPSFERNNWPDMADRRWSEQVYAFYGITPHWEQQTSSLPETAREGAPSQAVTIGAVVQNVDQSSRLLRFRTNNHEIIELQAPAGMLEQLETGHRIEVVIHKSDLAAPSTAAQPTIGQPAR